MTTAQLGQRVILNDAGSDEHVDVGQVGTVIGLGSKTGDNGIPDGHVKVLWDGGHSNNYQVGWNESYRLLLLDNAPAGVRHNGIICDVCREDNLAGMRWKCGECPNYDLCTPCYMKDEHDTSHCFIRFSTGRETGIPMSQRLGEKTSSTGLFLGATVKPGRDWQEQEERVGEGRIVDVTCMSNQPRSAVMVYWSKTEKVSKHRVGYDGKVDVTSVQDANGMTFYQNHLPLLGKQDALQIGDHVAVTIDAETLEALQLASGRRWIKSMTMIFGKVAEIKKITPDGEVEVSYSDGKTFIFPVEVLRKIPNFVIGDRVRVAEDLVFVMNLQVNSRNGWLPGMQHCLGLEGYVANVDVEKDVRVNLDNISNTLSWHPCTLTLLKRATSEDSPLPGSAIERVGNPQLTDLLQMMQVESDPTLSNDSNDEETKELVLAAKLGKVERVVEILSRCPEKANSTLQGKSALHEAALQGHMNVAQALVEMGADLDKPDAMSHTPVHTAVLGDEPAVLKYLLAKGADVKRVNMNGHTGLHIAAVKGYVDCARVLINHGCNVNLVDFNCNTALHVAIIKNQPEIIELLLETPEIDVAVTNDRKLNALQFAAFQNRSSIAKMIMKAFPGSPLIPTEEGQTLAHIAAINNHDDVLRTVVALKDLSIDAKNGNGQTALHLATEKGQSECIEILVNEGADMNCPDKDGDTALHLVAMVKAKDASRVNHSPTLQKIQQTYQRGGCDDSASALMCFMVQRGASVNVENQQCRTPLSFISKFEKLKDTLKKIAKGEGNEDFDGLQKTNLAKSSIFADNNLNSSKDTGSPERETPKSSPNEPKVGDFDLIHRIAISELEMGSLIGKGQFGVVHRAVWRATPVAVKKLSIQGSKQSDVEKEVAIHRRASHPNIVQIMALGYDGACDAYIVMQLIEGASLNDIIFPIHYDTKITLSRQQKVLISRLILQAVTFLHASNILHLDIKPANVLIEIETTRPYLCDLGLAHIKCRNVISQSSFGIRGTPCYMPPEAFSQSDMSRQHSDKHDVWSVAGTLVELFIEERLWGEVMHPFALIGQMINRTIGKPTALAALEHGAKGILDPCFNLDPEKRPSAVDLLTQFNALK